MEKQLRAVVCGLGNMGKTIVWSMTRFGFHTIALDNNPKAVEGLPENEFDFLCVEDHDSMTKAITFIKPDIVISSLPYHQTESVATFCIRNNIAYCDLGGRCDVSFRINNLAKHHASRPVFTDLGLAPGWVNILAEHGCRQVCSKEIKEVKMMVGGLPVSPDNPPLNYTLTWSVDGLINEYKDMCQIIQKGKVTNILGMEGLEKVQTKSLGELEAFYTSGGASHTIGDMHEKGIEECSYKTLRYVGHCDTVKFLIRHCKLSQECLLDIFNKGCVKPVNVDQVIIKVIIKTEESSWEKEVFIPNSLSMFSAMQKATGFSISSVAKMMAEEKLEGDKDQHRDYYTQYSRVLTYKDVNYQEFIENIDVLREHIKDAPYEKD